MAANPLDIAKKEKEASFNAELIRKIIVDLLTSTPDEVESEKIEVKGWCNSEKELADKVSDASSCLANSGGGYVFVGVAETHVTGRRFSACPHPSITPSWLTTHVQDMTRPPVNCWAFDATPLLSDISGPESGDLFVLRIPKKRYISAHVTHKGISKSRVGKECRTQFTAEDDRTKAWVPDASLEDLSTTSLDNAISQYRRIFRITTESTERSDFLVQTQLAEPFLPDEEYLPKFKISLAALLLFGKANSIKRYVPFFETVIKSGFEYVRVQQNIVESVRELCGSEHSSLRARMPGVPAHVFKELLVNAYVHRCYRIHSPVVISICPDRFEIQNPGELAGGLKVDHLINCIPVYRNLLLSEASRFIGLCDKVGQGIDLVYQGALEGGLPFPEFESENGSFSARISRNGSENFKEFMRRGNTGLRGLEEIIAVRLLWMQDSATLDQLAIVMQRKLESCRRILQELMTRLIVDSDDGHTFRLTTNVRRHIDNIFRSDQMSLDQMWS